MLVGQCAVDDESAEREEDGGEDEQRSEPEGEALRRARREPARIRGVHAGQPTARSPVSRKTSGRVGRPQLQVVFLTP